MKNDAKQAVRIDFASLNQRGKHKMNKITKHTLMAVLAASLGLSASLKFAPKPSAA